eukprot:403337588
MEHANNYIQHYCHPCKKLICYKCYPAHQEHIKDQGGNSEFTPEKLHSYLLQVRPELEKIHKEINLSLKIFNKALGREKEYFGDEIIDRVDKSFNLLKNIIPEQDIQKLHLNFHNQKRFSMTTPDPQSQITKSSEEELKSYKDNDQQENLLDAQNSMRFKENNQNHWLDELEKLRVEQQQFIDQVTLERQKQLQEFLIMNEASENKIKTLIDEKITSSKEQIGEDKNRIVQLINSTEHELKELLEIQQNNVNQAFEQFKVQTSNNLERDIQTNLSSRFNAFENGFETYNLKLTKLEKQVQNLADNYSTQMKLLNIEIDKTKNNLTSFKQTVNWLILKLQNKVTAYFKHKYLIYQDCILSYCLEDLEMGSNHLNSTNYVITRDLL